jgi:hypothetical protein
MAIGDSFRHVGDILDSLQCNDFDVIEVTPRDQSVVDDEEVTVEVTVDVPLLDDVDVADGVEIHASNLEMNGPSARIDLSFVLPVERGQQSPEEPSTDGGRLSTRDSGQDVPPHRDPAQLKRVYGTCESFTQMRDELGVDVTPEAVRQQMIKHGIHEAETQKPAAIINQVQASEESRAEDLDVIADGGALPGDLTLAQLVDIVESSRTLHHAQQRLGIGQEQTRSLLTRLNVLDCVIGRISTDSERNTSSAEIETRIRDSLSSIE